MIMSSIFGQGFDSPHLHCKENRKREDMGMLEILQFIFSSFWIFCGTVILLGLVGEIIVGVFEAVFRNKK